MTELRPELTMSDEWRAEITEMLNRFPEVRWDRFVLAPVPSDDDEQHGVVTVYGWVDRPDGRADFVLLEFATWGSVGFKTSSAQLSREFHARIYGDGDGVVHYDCQRVETEFPDVRQAIVVNAANEYGLPR